MRIFFLLILLLTHCASYPPVIEKELDVITHLAMQDKIKEWIRADCGSCHTSGLTTANPKALQVFDLKFTDWMSRMNKKQLEKTFVARLGSTVAAENRQYVSDALGAELYRRNMSKPY
jgi:starvation-inducible outer membrane lipoprotein